MELEVQIEKRLEGFRLDVSFTAGRSTLGILGPSGSGKSMALRCIAGLETPSAGKIVLNGRTLFDSGRGINLPSRARRVGLLFQDYALFPHLTVAENIAFGLPGLARREMAQRVGEQIARVQLQGLEHRYPRELSGGQQQRVALARALATDPEALLLDEPLSALDMILRAQIERLIVATLGSYRGISLYVTHNLDEAYRIAEEMVMIVEGREIAFGPKEEIFRHPKSLAAAQVTGCRNFSRARAISENEVEAFDWGCRLQVTQAMPAAIEHVGIRAHDLDWAGDGVGPNVLPCVLASVTEEPFQVTVELKLQAASPSSANHLVQAEVSRAAWTSLRSRTLPWFVRLPPDKILLLES